VVFGHLVNGACVISKPSHPQTVSDANQSELGRS